MKMLKVENIGRFGNAVFRFLASRLFCILFNYTIVYKDNTLNYYINLNDENFIEWMDEIIKNNRIYNISNTYINFNGYYQHDYIYILFKKNLLEYIKNNPNELIITDKNEQYKCIELLGNKPIIEYKYKTVVHLRIEDFIELNLAMDPRCLDPVLEKCDEPFLFVHKEVENDNDKKYIQYIKDKYPDSQFYTNDMISSYNIMRNSEVLVCSRSTLSWAAAFFNEINVKTYMPKNYGTLKHETFQYPNNNTEIYEWNIISKEELIAL